MEIRVAERLNYWSFNESILPEVQKYMKEKPYENLYLDFESTEFISPSVLCDLLSITNVIKGKVTGKIHFLFGYNTSLISFLKNTDFFLMVDVGRTLFTDVLDLGGEDSSYSSYSKFMKKRENTDKFRRINLPRERDDDYGPAHEIIYYDKNKGVDAEKQRISSTVQRDFWAFYSKKQHAINNIGINYECCEYLANAYSEIVINSYFHGGKNYCFYTFQNYNHSGLSFVSSDTGIGYHGSFVEKISAGKKRRGLFTSNEYTQITDVKRQSLMSIVEGLLYRHFNPKQAFDHGILDIIKIILGVGRNNNAILRIQSDYAMLQLDTVSLPWLFSGTNQDRQYNGVYYNITPKTDMFRKIVLDENTHSTWERSRHIVYSDFCFPGVHISATIDSPRNERGR